MCFLQPYKLYIYWYHISLYVELTMGVYACLETTLSQYIQLLLCCQFHIVPHSRAKQCRAGQISCMPWASGVIAQSRLHTGGSNVPLWIKKRSEADLRRESLCSHPRSGPDWQPFVECKFPLEQHSSGTWCLGNTWMHTFAAAPLSCHDCPAVSACVSIDNK